MKELTIFNRRYLGSKQKLLNFIEDSLEKEGIKFNSLIDIFAGTGVVAYYFRNKKVIVNDLLKFNYFAYEVWFGNGELNKQKADKLIDIYNKKEVIEENYLSRTFTETYFSFNDTKKIGFIRDDIENKFSNGEITLREKYYLITSLLYSADKIANTVGHYDAYRKIGKLEDKFLMHPLSIENCESKNNEVYCEDANVLIEKIEGDLLYIDPPYNSRQYCDAYHLLENIALWEKPRVDGVALKMDRSSMKSKYCTRKAIDSFSELIDKAKVKYIVVSYNNMYEKGAGRSQSILKESDILTILSKKGLVKVYEKDFQPFTTGKSNIENHKERLYICFVNNFDSKNKLKGSNTEKKIKSPLNYTGGKFKIIEDLLDVFPKEINTFVDLFCGGCNVAVNVNANKIIANDYCKELIDLFSYLKKYDYFEINEKIESILRQYNLSYSFENGYEFYNTTSSDGLGKYNKEGYANLKNAYNSMESSEDKNLYFLVLIIYGFNNQIRFNKNGLFNIPVGKRDYNNSIKKNLNDFITAIRNKDIIFTSIDFRNIDFNSLSEGDFVYLDPPYLLGCATYNESNAWTDKEELEMYEIMNNLDKRGVKFALSNVIEHKGKIHTKLSELAIKNRYNIHFVDRKYNNASYQVKDKEAKTVEVIITNY